MVQICIPPDISDAIRRTERTSEQDTKPNWTQSPEDSADPSVADTGWQPLGVAETTGPKVYFARHLGKYAWSILP